MLVLISLLKILILCHDDFFFLTQIKIEKMKAIFNILSLAMDGSRGRPPSSNKSQGAQSSGRDEKYMAGVEQAEEKPWCLPCCCSSSPL